MEEPKVKYAFNKTFSAKTCSQTLKIPRCFEKYIKMKEHDERACLIGTRRGVWSVDLVRKDGGLYFQRGWLEFQKCNNLSDMDYLVFEYDGMVGFNVKILQEKISAPEHVEPSQHHLKQETAEQGGSESCVDQDRLSFVQIMKHYHVRRSPIIRFPAWFVEEHFSGYGEKVEIVLENTSGHKWPLTLDLKSKSYRGWSQFVRGNDIKEGDTCKFEIVRELAMSVHISPNKVSSHLKQGKGPDDPQLFTRACKKPKHTDAIETAEQGGSESCDDQDRLSFVQIMKHYHVKRPLMIRFPAWLVKEHFSGHGEKVEFVLENAAGHKWQLTLALKSKNVCKGWSKFVHGNGIEEGDTCRFEVVRKLTMRVHISPNKASSHSKQGKSPDDTQLLTRAGKKPNHADDLEQSREHRATDSDRLSFVKEMRNCNTNPPFNFKIPSWFVRQHFSGYGENVQVVIKNTRGQQWIVNVVPKLQTIYGGWTQFVRDNEIKQGDTCTFKLISKLTMSVHISSSKPSSQLSGNQDHASHAQKPSNQKDQGESSDDEDSPSFTIHMRPYNARIFNVGCKFIGKHCCSYGNVEKIVLKNEQGKRWCVNMTRQRKGGLMSGGVSAFVRDNKIKERDTCTFKLVGDREMLVCISRRSQVEKDSGVWVEGRTCDARGRRASGGCSNKRKRSGEEDGIARKVEATAEEVAELREETRMIRQMLQQMNKSKPC